MKCSPVELVENRLGRINKIITTLRLLAEHHSNDDFAIDLILASVDYLALEQKIWIAVRRQLQAQNKIMFGAMKALAITESFFSKVEVDAINDG